MNSFHDYFTYLYRFFNFAENGIGVGDSEEANAPFDKKLFQDDVDEIDDELRKCQLKEGSTASN